jgi:NAD(P)-dependent dehydrogenase (short-subunit alcohol dehydrogenase family)
VSERAGRLQDKVVLVTGAARGIGAASARRMASEGAILWLNDIAEEIEAVAAELGATASIGDVSDPEYVTGWVDAAAAQHGRIDVLYNNVGVSRTGLIGRSQR